MNTNKVYQVRVVIYGEEYIHTDHDGEWRFDTIEEAMELFDYVCENEYDEEIQIVRANWDEDRVVDEDEEVEIVVKRRLKLCV